MSQFHEPVNMEFPPSPPHVPVVAPMTLATILHDNTSDSVVSSSSSPVRIDEHSIESTYNYPGA
ncbi:hypothetical protein MUCCIDRAFT_105938 [Mucor lusitanicus CBS 277.49]|uniref:Uncharacterized protein n=1 Tax=Mucor lusitanicus CBS 277.49 TaxID=747725 RepID=A0A162RV26_MUCCL|nr:hypothetical protein MUCCIDRAFT_105938 [Mucor lusitanicus CBS 277.49]